jgi:tRNA modification GTPase
MQGALGARAESWRERLTRALALIEARIDFSDEADVQNSAQGDLIAPALALARELEDEIAAALADGKRGERLRDGLVVAIAGPPNAGKSTLLNRIARREAAIVSPYAGTTRDVIEVHLDLAGLPVTLLDTAGIRDSDDPVEREGVRRARERAAAADLVLWVVDASEPDQSSAVIAGHRPESLAPEGDYGFRARPAGPPRNDGDLASPSPPTWLVRNKIDSISGIRRNESEHNNLSKNEPLLQTNEPLKDMVNNRLMGSNEARFTSGELVFNLSATTGEGFESLLAALTRHADGFLAGTEPALVTRERHRHALEDALAALRRAGKPALAGREDLLAEELRIAARALGRLTGRVDVEDILDVIFRDFCIGK